MAYKQPVIKPFCRQCEYFCGKTYRQTLVCAPHPRHLTEADMEIEIVWANPNRRWWERLIAGLRRRGGRHG